METFSNVEINMIGLVIILIVIVNMPLKKNRLLFDQKLFLDLIFFTSVLLILDTLQLFLDGRPGFLLREIQYGAMIVFFCLNPVPCLLYTLYSDYQINRNPVRIRKLILPLMLPLMINAIAVILSPWYHYIFYLDSRNIYHRGNYMLMVAFICYLYIILAVSQVIWKRNRIKKSEYHALLIFALPPTVGGIIQTLYYGTTLLWVCVAIAILIVYIKLQNNNIYTDYLTGLSNRRQLDIYLQETLNKRSRGNYLAGMMIDINDFKKINDLYGHDLGDQALKHTGRILRKSFGKDDFIARYGGDEFIIIFEIKKIKDMESARKRIQKRTDELNNAKKVPYQLQLSTGYDIFDYKSGITVRQFLKRIDDLMYEDKKRQKLRKTEFPNDK